MQEIKTFVLENGAKDAKFIDVANIVFDRSFRKSCEANQCGKYARCHTCPPLVGDIDELINKAKSYNTALVYQWIGELEDSYDFEGMMDAGVEMNELTQKILTEFKSAYPDALYLGSGGCSICDRCTAIENLPCRFPEKALSPLETYGIAVSQLAKSCDMKYINGENTVTYFAAVLLK